MFRTGMVIGMIAVILILSGSIYYIWTGIRRFSWVRSLKEEERRWKYRLAKLVYVLVLFTAFALELTSTVVVLLHLVVFQAAVDLIAWLIKKVSQKEWKRNYQGALVLLVTILYFGIGWYNAHHVTETRYTVHTDKDMNGSRLRILQITDMHVGATFDGDQFADHMKEAQKCDPDMILLTGDFVDEGTTESDMVKSCRALGSMKSTYGTYFIYGNHDKGNYTSSREFTGEDLEKELKKNGIHILEDETVLIDDRFYVIGRQDRSEESYGGGRAELSQMMKELDKTKYSIVLDHQPNDFDAEREAGADLVLCGHTHGGHIFPTGQISVWTKINCMAYGIRTEGNTTFEVSSGISGWEIPFKTGCISEYVVIDVEE